MYKRLIKAEAIVAVLDPPLYRVDIGIIVGKYIGETKKNLSKAFNTSDTADVILLFDEADALIGRRTELADAHDRYTNSGIAYLLQSLEEYAGIFIVATNLHEKLDGAFLRRMRLLLPPLTEERRREKPVKGIFQMG